MKKLSSILAVGLVIIFAQVILAGDIYKWTDKNGVVHYGDRPTSNAIDTGYSNTPGVSSMGPDKSIKRRERFEQIKEQADTRYETCRASYSGLELQKCMDYTTAWADKELEKIGLERPKY